MTDVSNVPSPAAIGALAAQLRRLAALEQTAVYQEMLRAADAKARPVTVQRPEAADRPPDFGREREVVCACGRTFTARSSTAKWHSEACRLEHERERARERAREEKAAA